MNNLYLIPLQNPDPNLYRDEFGALWRRGAMTNDGYSILFECNPESLEWHPDTSGAEEFSPAEMLDLEIVEPK